PRRARLGDRGGRRRDGGAAPRDAALALARPRADLGGAELVRSRGRSRGARASPAREGSRGRGDVRLARGRPRRRRGAMGGRAGDLPGARRAERDRSLHGRARRGCGGARRPRPRRGAVPRERRGLRAAWARAQDGGRALKTRSDRVHARRARLRLRVRAPGDRDPARPRRSRRPLRVACEPRAGPARARPRRGGADCARGGPRPRRRARAQPLARPRPRSRRCARPPGRAARARGASRRRVPSLVRGDRDAASRRGVASPRTDARGRSRRPRRRHRGGPSHRGTRDGHAARRPGRPQDRRRRVSRRTLPLALACLALAAGCGGRAHRAASSTGEWRSNALGVLVQLREDVSLTATGSSTLAEARRALTNDSDLYALLLAYSDLGGCRATVAHAGAPPELERVLARPVRMLERAAASFTRATTRSDPRALLRAARQAHAAEPLLVRAIAAVRAHTG